MGGNKSTTKKLKKFLVKLKWCMKALKQQPIRTVPNEELIEILGRRAVVPEGHFALFAGKGDEEVKRFVVELRYLKSPQILNLLKEAEDEYGFHQEGALVVPCTPQQLRKVLEDNF